MTLAREPSAVLTAGVAFAPTVSLAFLLGGYYATFWGWGALTLSWAAAVALIVRRRIPFGALDIAAVASLIGLCAWTAASTLWSLSVTGSVLEVERTLVYVAGMLAVLVVATDAVPLLAGVAAASSIACTYGLATRLFPGTLTAYDPKNSQLARPLGYSNALGLFAAIGVLLCLGFVARGRSGPTRAVAAAAVVPLVSTVYFTFGRATWAALGIGIAAALALDPRRQELAIAVLALAPIGALAVWLSSRAHGLTHEHALRAGAAHDGHRLAVALLLLVAVAAIVGWRLGLPDWSAGRWRPLRVGVFTSLIAVALAGAGAGVARYGNPVRALEHGYDHFKTQPPPTEGNLNRRLLSFSGNWRQEWWPVAWRDARAHPWAGSGAGTYELYWLQRRRVAVNVRDVHNLYLETLAELGVVGLALLLAVLAVPVVAAIRARGHPLVPTAFGAFVAYLLHSGLQWNWELPAVTLAAFFAGAGAIVAARGPKLMSVPTRVGALILALVICVSAAVGLVGNVALANSARAARAGNWKRAETQARKAADWARWSSEPLRWLADAQLATGREAAARATIRRALDKDPHDWQLWFGLALASSGPERRAALARAASLNPLSPEIAAWRKRGATGR